MKKSLIIATLFLIILSSFLIQAAENQTNQTTTVSDDDSNSEKITKAFECLEEKVGSCSSLTTQEIALTIMATPDDDVFDDCVDELQSRESSNHWNNVLETALAIIALEHAGKDTEKSVEWLLTQNKTPTDLIWYLQQDSNEASECHIGYDATDYTINVDENKKIDKSAGSCLTKAQSSFWLQISSNCYDKKFKIECDKDFIANLIYKNKKSPTIYVLEGTSSAPAFGSVELKVTSSCFGDSTGCNYEATAWATLALLETDHNVDDFIPYIVAMSETSTQYLPDAFIYILTNYEDYASSLIADQKLGNYWEAKSTAYNKYYDTSLALIALGSSSSEQISKARDWLLFAQGSNGCWNNKILDTAMVLWALEGRSGRIPSSGSSVTYCTQAGFFCIPSQECPSVQDIGDNYFCSSLSDTCCETENLQSCETYQGQICSSDKICIGNTKKASDTTECCTGSCEEKVTESECESNFYTCMSTCSEYQESVPTYSCNLGQVCCKTKTTQEKSSTWWIWLLVILIAIVLAAIAYIYREQLKLWWFQLKSKFKKDKSPPSNSRPNRPPFPPPVSPRPGFPPIRRAPQIPPTRPTPLPPTAQRRSYDRRDKDMSDTFNKLRDMSK